MRNEAQRINPTRYWFRRWTLAALCSLMLSACEADVDDEPSSAAVSPAVAPVGEAAANDQQSTDAPIPIDPSLSDFPVRTFTDDLDGMVERRIIRALVPYSPIFYFVDENARPRGISQDYIAALENYLNEQLDTGGIPITMAAIPLTRERLIPRLLEGHGDLIVADLTITDERLARMSFTEAIADSVNEIVVSGPGAAPITALDELSGHTVLSRPDSSYMESLIALNERFEAKGLPAIEIQSVPGYFEIGDVLEMVNAGIADYTVADSHMATYWQHALPDIQLHPELILREGGRIGWAMRPDSPQLKAMLDDFVSTHRDGTLFGNITIDRYLQDPQWITNPNQTEAMGRFNDMAHLFEQYAGSYELDWLMMVAQGYQESTLDQSVRSHRGAIGVMQLLQSTADDMDVGDIVELENNIHAGVKYVRWVIDNFFDDPAIDERNKLLLALASYNAGPGRIRRLRQEAAEQGLNPNQWFDHVEIMAARDIGRETVNYVRNIFKYYVAYRLIVLNQERINQASTTQG
ncbi:MAG: transporter substrate-binding domain-containing protein [Pseudomonadota bacterium]